ncbi:MAG TPA: hypothetical protein VF062_25035 [Candidatus Limnocylindrales bacterium]
MDGQGADAQHAADVLALALEDVGFDVGRAFPMLSSGIGADGVGFVQLGRVTGGVASGLAWVLAEAAGRGLTVSA